MPNASNKTVDVVCIVPFIFRIPQHLQSSKFDAVFTEKGIGHCALPRPGSNLHFVDLKCQSSLETVTRFSSFQKSPPGKILKSFLALDENSRRPACAASAGVSAAGILSLHSLPFAHSLAEGRRSMVIDGWSRMSPCRSHVPAHHAASLCLPPRCALCAASLLPPLWRRLCPTSPLPLLAAHEIDLAPEL